MELWPVLWLFVALKIPLLAALWIIWWAVRAQPAAADEEGSEDDGGRGPDHPRPRRPRAPRRGPHAGLPTPPPSRVRAHGRPLARHRQQSLPR